METAEGARAEEEMEAAVLGVAVMAEEGWGAKVGNCTLRHNLSSQLQSHTGVALHTNHTASLDRRPGRRRCPRGCTSLRTSLAVVSMAEAAEAARAVAMKAGTCTEVRSRHSQPLCRTAARLHRGPSASPVHHLGKHHRPHACRCCRTTWAVPRAAAGEAVVAKAVVALAVVARAGAAGVAAEMVEAMAEGTGEVLVVAKAAAKAAEKGAAMEVETAAVRVVATAAVRAVEKAAVRAAVTVAE